MKIEQIIKPKRVNVEIKRLEEQLAVTDPLTSDYGYLVEMITNLKKTKLIKNEIKIPTEVLIAGGFALVRTMMILNYEQFDVITSKAFTSPRD